MTAISGAELYPLRFKEILRNYGFGDRWIVREFAKTGLPDDHRISETWEVCDRPTESSVIVNGPLAGRTLREAIEAYGERLLGTQVVERLGPRFPLIIKLLDASNRLGEQLHPDDELTRKWGLSDYSGKTEAWYMLKTRPGARAYCGNRPGVTLEQFVEALRKDEVRSLMLEHEARPGDCFLLYAGMMHHSPGGLLFYEVMQNSDVTIGLRPGQRQRTEQEREQWMSRAAEAVRLEDGADCRTQPVTVASGRNMCTFVLACDRFALERMDLTEPWPVPADARRFLALTIIEGEAELTCGASRERLLPGNSCLIPACLRGVSLSPRPSASVLVSYVPDLVRDVVEPLRAAGVQADAIRRLGGVTALNPLKDLV